jgi:DnaJ-class molecular chaperone
MLGVLPNAPTTDIASRFRMLAINYHPDKHIETMAKSNYIFADLCEAYEVLSDCNSYLLMLFRTSKKDL